jgi:hypothetical protein
MNSHLSVKHGSTFDGRPLATIDGLPGGDAELTPPQLRTLAAAMNAVASDCEALFQGEARNARRTYSLVSEEAQGAASPTPHRGKTPREPLDLREAEIVANVKVPGTVLYDLDALGQQLCGEIELLASCAIERLTPDAASLMEAKTLLLLVKERAEMVFAGINSAAEDHGCHYFDTETWERAKGIWRRHGEAKGGAA